MSGVCDDLMVLDRAQYVEIGLHYENLFVVDIDMESKLDTGDICMVRVWLIVGIG